jgi:hypothetical protein
VADPTATRSPDLVSHPAGDEPDAPGYERVGSATATAASRPRSRLARALPPTPSRWPTSTATRTPTWSPPIKPVTT